MKQNMDTKVVQGTHRPTDVVTESGGDRRGIVLTVLGALGAAAWIKGRTDPPVSDVLPEPTSAHIGASPNATSGTEVIWVDTVFGNLGPLDRSNGDLNKSPNQMPGQPPVIAIAKGAVTPGDGGGGVFFWSDVPNAQDDGGTIIVPKYAPPAHGGPFADGGPPGNGHGNGPINGIPSAQNGSWRRIYSGPLNAKWFGTGNFARIGIQAAIDAASAAGGGSVYVPPGVYDIDKAISVKSFVELRGAGPSTILKLDATKVNETSMRAFETVVLKVDGQQRVRIADLQVDGNKSAIPDLTCMFPINNVHPNPSTLTGILVRHASKPDSAAKCRITEDVLVENCVVANCAFDGIGVLSARRVTIRNCISNDCGIGYWLGNGIYVASQPVPLFDDGDTCPTLPPNTEDCVVEGCSAFGSLHSGIESYGAAVRTQIRNCRTDAIFVNTNGKQVAAQTMILGCYINHSQQQLYEGAIQLLAPSGAMVANCHVIANAIGIVMGGSSCPATPSITDSGNMIVGNTISYVGPCLPTNPECQAGTCQSLGTVEFRGACSICGSSDVNCLTKPKIGGPAAAIYVASQTEMLIAGNNIHSFDTGILTYVCSGCTIATNVIRQANGAGCPNSVGIGIRMTSSNIAVTKNIVSGCEWGICDYQSADYNVYLYNVARENAFGFNGSAIVANTYQCTPTVPPRGAGDNSQFPTTLNLGFV